MTVSGIRCVHVHLCPPTHFYKGIFPILFVQETIKHGKQIQLFDIRSMVENNGQGITRNFSWDPLQIHHSLLDFCPPTRLWKGSLLWMDEILHHQRNPG